MNLAVNARDAMPKGGRLIIGTERVVMDAVCVRNHPEARGGVQQRGVDGVGEQRHQAVGVAGGLMKLGARRRAVVREHLHFDAGTRDLGGIDGEPPGDEEAHAAEIPPAAASC